VGKSKETRRQGRVSLEDFEEMPERRRAEDDKEREGGEILGIILKHMRHRGIYLTFIGNREILRPKRVGSRETEVEETLARIPEPN